jgi:hypothetical protein
MIFAGIVMALAVFYNPGRSAGVRLDGRRLKT